MTQEDMESVEPMLYHLAHQMAPVGGYPSADDLVQEAWVRIMEYTASYSPGRATFSTWARRVGQTTMLNYLRDCTRQCGMLDPSELRALVGVATEMEADPLDVLLTTELQGTLFEALEEATDETCAMAYDRFIEGRSFVEMAAEWQLPADTIRKRMNRLEAAMRERGNTYE